MGYLLGKFRLFFSVSLLIMLSMHLFQCKTDKVKHGYFVLEKFNQKFRENPLKNPPQSYYTGNAIIVREKSNILYYHKMSWWNCVEIDLIPPPFNHKIAQVQEFQSIHGVIDLLRTNEDIKLITLVSDSDVVRNPLFFQHRDSIKTLSNAYMVTPRIWTPDEMIALQLFELRR